MPPHDSGLDWKPWREIDWTNAGARVGIGDAVWPGITLGQGGAAQAGPTGDPWIDSNGWLIQYARARAPRSEIWLRPAAESGAAPPERNTMLLAVAEAAAFGAQASAACTCDDVRQWFQAHREWSAWPVQAELNIVSSFSGANTDFAAEVLNLAARRGLAFHLNAAWQAHRAVLWLDETPPREAESYAGLLICPAKAAAGMRLRREPDAPHPRYDLFRSASGRVAVPRAEWDDPWQVAADAHLLLSRRHDAVRLFNGGSILAHATRDPKQPRGVIQLLNYTLRASAAPVVIQVRDRVRRARGWPLGAREPVPLALSRNELQLPPFPLYAAIELEYA